MYFLVDAITIFAIVIGVLINDLYIHLLVMIRIREMNAIIKEIDERLRIS